jgi:hypothetical protein
MQLACYCLLVEEETGERVPFGVIRYRDRQLRVDYTDELRGSLLALLAEMRAAREETRGRASQPRREGALRRVQLPRNLRRVAGGLKRRIALIRGVNRQTRSSRSWRVMMPEMRPYSSTRIAGTLLQVARHLCHAVVNVDDGETRAHHFAHRRVQQLAVAEHFRQHPVLPERPDGLPFLDHGDAGEAEFVHLRQHVGDAFRRARRRRETSANARPSFR